MTKTPKSKKLPDLLLKIFLIVILILVGLKLSLDRRDDQLTADQSADSTRTFLSNCLNRNGAMMYGVDTCEFCQTQKKMFGEDFAKIKYINCDFEENLCLQKGIKYYPAWEIEGKIYTGIQTFASLAQASNCSNI